MEFVNVQIPKPDFDYSEVAKEKARILNKNFITYSRIFAYYRKMKDSEQILRKIESDFYSLTDNYQRLVFLSELLLYVRKIKESQTDFSDEESKTVWYAAINNFQHFLYKLATETGLQLNQDVFSVQESNEASSKIDFIISKIKQLQAGQEVIYEEFEQAKTQMIKDLENSKSDIILGKGKSLLLLIGTGTKWLADKIASDIYDNIKADFYALLKIYGGMAVSTLKNFFLIN